LNEYPAKIESLISLNKHLKDSIADKLKTVQEYLEKTVNILQAMLCSPFGAQQIKTIITYLDDAVKAATAIVNMLPGVPPWPVKTSLALATAAISILSDLSVSAITQAMDSTIDKVVLVIGFVKVAVSKLINTLAESKTTQ